MEKRIVPCRDRLFIWMGQTLFWMKKCLGIYFAAQIYWVRQGGRAPDLSGSSVTYNQGSMTVEAVCERLSKRQFEEGEDIFAVQWSGIHKMAQTGDIRGLRYPAS